MPSELINVTLHRDSELESWGFGLTGGSDEDLPLTVSEINGRESSEFTFSDAVEAIGRSEETLELTIERACASRKISTEKSAGSFSLFIGSKKAAEVVQDNEAFYSNRQELERTTTAAIKLDPKTNESSYIKSELKTVNRKVSAPRKESATKTPESSSLAEESFSNEQEQEEEEVIEELEQEAENARALQESTEQQVNQVENQVGDGPATIPVSEPIQSVRITLQPSKTFQSGEAKTDTEEIPSKAKSFVVGSVIETRAQEGSVHSSITFPIKAVSSSEKVQPLVYKDKKRKSSEENTSKGYVKVPKPVLIPNFSLVDETLLSKEDNPSESLNSQSVVIPKQRLVEEGFTTPKPKDRQEEEKLQPQKDRESKNQEEVVFIKLPEVRKESKAADQGHRPKIISEDHSCQGDDPKDQKETVHEKVRERNQTEKEATYGAESDNQVCRNSTNQEKPLFVKLPIKEFPVYSSGITAETEEPLETYQFNVFSAKVLKVLEKDQTQDKDIDIKTTKRDQKPELPAHSKDTKPLKMSSEAYLEDETHVCEDFAESNVPGNVPISQGEVGEHPGTVLTEEPSDDNEYLQENNELLFTGEDADEIAMRDLHTPEIHIVPPDPATEPLEETEPANNVTYDLRKPNKKKKRSLRIRVRAEPGKPDGNAEDDEEPQPDQISEQKANFIESREVTSPLRQGKNKEIPRGKMNRTFKFLEEERPIHKLPRPKPNRLKDWNCPWVKSDGQGLKGVLRSFVGVEPVVAPVATSHHHFYSEPHSILDEPLTDEEVRAMQQRFYEEQERKIKEEEEKKRREQEEIDWRRREILEAERQFEEQKRRHLAEEEEQRRRLDAGNQEKLDSDKRVRFVDSNDVESQYRDDEGDHEFMPTLENIDVRSKAERILREELEGEDRELLENLTQALRSGMEQYAYDEGSEPSADELIEVLKNLENLAVRNPALYKAIVDQIKINQPDERYDQDQAYYDEENEGEEEPDLSNEDQHHIPEYAENSEHLYKSTQQPSEEDHDRIQENRLPAPEPIPESLKKPVQLPQPEQQKVTMPPRTMIRQAYEETAQESNQTIMSKPDYDYPWAGSLKPVSHEIFSRKNKPKRDDPGPCPWAGSLKHVKGATWAARKKDDNDTPPWATTLRHVRPPNTNKPGKMSQQQQQQNNIASKPFHKDTYERQVREDMERKSQEGNERNDQPAERTVSSVLLKVLMPKLLRIHGSKYEPLDEDESLKIMEEILALKIGLNPNQSVDDNDEANQMVQAIEQGEIDESVYSQMADELEQAAKIRSKIRENLGEKQVDYRESESQSSESRHPQLSPSIRGPMEVPEDEVEF